MLCVVLFVAKFVTSADMSTAIIYMYMKFVPCNWHDSIAGLQTAYRSAPTENFLSQASRLDLAGLSDLGEGGSLLGPELLGDDGAEGELGSHHCCSARSFMRVSTH